MCGVRSTGLASPHKLVRADLNESIGVAGLGGNEVDLPNAERADAGSARVVVVADLKVEVNVVGAGGDGKERVVGPLERAHQPHVANAHVVTGATIHGGLGVFDHVALAVLGAEGEVGALRVGVRLDLG